MKKNGLKIVIMAILLAMLAVFVVFSIEDQKRKIADKNDEKSVKDISENVTLTIGGCDIGEYTIVYGIKAKQAALNLKNYTEKLTGNKISVSVIKPASKFIYVGIDKKESGIYIHDGDVRIIGQDITDVSKKVNVFANTYLGYAFAGEEREHIIENTKTVNIPADVFDCDTPWMAEREPIICLWKTDNARGIYSDRDVCLASELMSFSDDELYTYVKMMKQCGFTGIQVTDMCSAWAQYGGYEFVHQRLRLMADAAHSMDMKFTLWVWGAEFNGYGWTEKDIVYYTDTLLARDNPETVEIFDKYYTIYASLADCCDRVIMHFNDPGCLITSEDIGFYANMFKEKCQTINSDIDFGINCYTYAIQLPAVIEYTGNDITVYTGIVHTKEERETCENFRTWAKELGVRLGVWSWNLGEMEIDQLAEMNVNANLIKDCYLNTLELDDEYKPEYWSEMDSYHVLNYFSVYCEGRLLQDPSLDANEVLMEACVRLVGEENAEGLYRAAKLVEKARTGNSWKEFKSEYDEYILLSDNYPAEEIYEESKQVLEILENMSRSDDLECFVAMPVTSNEFVKMMIPQIRQINEFAEFRIELSKAKAIVSDSSRTNQIEYFLNTLYTPVDEYNTIVGAWGQTEARAQYILLDGFCKENNLETPSDAVFEYNRKQRILGELKDKQRKTSMKYTSEKRNAFQGGNAFGEDETERLVNELISDGLLIEDANEKVYLSDWEKYKYDF